MVPKPLFINDSSLSVSGNRHQGDRSLRPVEILKQVGVSLISVVLLAGMSTVSSAQDPAPQPSVDSTPAAAAVPDLRVSLLPPQATNPGRGAIKIESSDDSETDAIQSGNHLPPFAAAEGPDATIAKRPWLLEKIIGPGKEKTQKMIPPRPPVDPPSIGALAPRSPANGSSAVGSSVLGSMNRDATASQKNPYPGPSRSNTSRPLDQDGWVAVKRKPLRDPQPRIETKTTQGKNRVDSDRKSITFSGPRSSQPSLQARTRLQPSIQTRRPTESRSPSFEGSQSANDDELSLHGPLNADSAFDKQPASNQSTSKQSTSKGQSSNDSPGPAVSKLRSLRPLPSTSRSLQLIPTEKNRRQPNSVQPDAVPSSDSKPTSAKTNSDSLSQNLNSFSRQQSNQDLPTERIARGSIRSSDFNPKRRIIEKKLPKQVSRGHVGDVDLEDRANGRLGMSPSSKTYPGLRNDDSQKLPSKAKSEKQDSPQSTEELDRDYTGTPKSAKTLTRQVARMKRPIQSVLNHYYRDQEVAKDRSNWGMLHAVMVWGLDTRVIVGRTTHSTIAWIAGNNSCRGQRLFESDGDRIGIKSGPGLQGHQGQFLAIMALCGVPRDYPIYADGVKYSIEHVIRREMDDCQAGEELTFTLIALSHYLDSDATWISSDGETWSLERLIQEELRQPIVGAACGGTHRLMGFGHALRNRRMQGRPINGQWERAKKFTDDFVQYAYRLQNRDGSMSTDWFEGRQDNGKMDRKVQTTGHIVEWLLTVTPDSQLQNPRLVSAVNYLLRATDSGRKREWSIGPKGHALRSLAMYYERVYGSGTAWRSNRIAKR